LLILNSYPLKEWSTNAFLLSYRDTLTPVIPVSSLATCRICQAGCNFCRHCIPFLRLGRISITRWKHSWPSPATSYQRPSPISLKGGMDQSVAIPSSPLIDMPVDHAAGGKTKTPG